MLFWFGNSRTCANFRRSCDSGNPCDCLDLPQFAEWFEAECWAANANFTSNFTSTSAAVNDAPALLQNVNPYSILVAIVTAMAMLSLIALSVLYVRFQKRNKVVAVLKDSVMVAQQSVVRVQLQNKQALADNARLQKSLEAAQQVVDRNIKEGGAALAAYKLRHAELTMGVQLGAGSFGTVYHGTFRGAECAVKTVRATKITDQMVQEFIGEITLMAPLRHANLVGLIGGCWTDGPDKLCIVLEYCSQGSLGGMVKDPSNTWETHYNEIVLGVAQCFKYLHHEQPGKPLIHRDLKPDNVLIAGDGTAKVADFGESTRFEDESAAKEDDGNLSMTMVGTPMYCVRVHLLNYVSSLASLITMC